MRETTRYILSQVGQLIGYPIEIAQGSALRRRPVEIACIHIHHYAAVEED